MLHGGPRRESVAIEKDGVVPAAVDLLLDQAVEHPAIDGRAVRDRRDALDGEIDAAQADPRLQLGLRQCRAERSSIHQSCLLSWTGFRIGGECALVWSAVPTA